MNEHIKSALRAYTIQSTKVLAQTTAILSKVAGGIPVTRDECDTLAKEQGELVILQDRLLQALAQFH